MNVHINWTRTDQAFVKMNKCPTCKTRRKMWGSFQEWYGTTWTCLTCGDEWADGERAERPFRRGWRAENIAAARRQAERAGVDLRRLTP